MLFLLTKDSSTDAKDIRAIGNVCKVTTHNATPMTNTFARSSAPFDHSFNILYWIYSPTNSNFNLNNHKNIKINNFEKTWKICKEKHLDIEIPQEAVEILFSRNPFGAVLVTS